MGRCWPVSKRPFARLSLAASCICASSILGVACVSPRAVTTIPLAVSADSVSAQVANELWRFYATLSIGQASSLGDISACVASSMGMDAADACVQSLSRRAEDSSYHARMMRHADSLSVRLHTLHLAVGAHPVLDETRFFVHAWRRDSAAFAIELPACRSAAWWCDALLGLAHHRLGAITVAETHFARMFSAMPAAQACLWRTLPKIPRSSCSHSDPSADSLSWWLADPLWLDVGNDRWTEHVSRVVLSDMFAHHLNLLADYDYTRRQSKSSREWSAVSLPILASRYGVYALHVWPEINVRRVRRAEPRLVRLWDLAGPRYEFLPLEPQLFDRTLPTDSTRLGTWPAPFPGGGASCRNRDCLTRPGSPLLAARRMFTSRGLIRNVTQPWLGSAEAYGRHQRFDHVPAFQAVTLPRDSGRMLFAAYVVGRVGTPGVKGAAFSRGPTDSVVRLLESSVVNGTVRVAGRIPEDGGVLSLEAVTDIQQVWRRRFFLPAESAASDVSAVVLLEAREGETSASLAPSVLPRELPLDRLLARTTLYLSDRIELYWEVSGALESTAASLEFRRLDRSTWGQLTGLFRRGADGRSVRVEPGAPDVVVRSRAQVGFALPFALSSLEPGQYEVRAIARDAKTGTEHVGSWSAFELRR